MLFSSLYLLDSWDSNSYRDMYIQGNAAEFAGTMDSTAAAAAEEQQIQSLMSETDWPGKTHTYKVFIFYSRKENL